jgi:tRNA threonylcarbamoyladenosine biosynthesis protein TsaE
MSSVFCKEASRSGARRCLDWRNGRKAYTDASPTFYLKTAFADYNLFKVKEYTDLAMLLPSEIFETTYDCASEADLLRFGQTLGQALQAGDVLALCGELGAGKTTLCRGIGIGWGAQQAVTSPTFLLVNEYSRADGATLHHLDCYRLGEHAEIESIDLLERMAHRIPLLIEWADYVAEHLPSETLWITLTFAEPGRQVHLQNKDASWQQRLAVLSQSR